MTSPPRLADLPYLAATLAMALTIILPWAYGLQSEEEMPVLEAASAPPWALSVSPAPAPSFPDPAVQLAGEAGAPPTDLSQQ